MKRTAQMLVAILALTGFTMFIGGCERELGHTEETTIKDDGTVNTEEKTVTQDTDGDTTITETETTRRPGDPN